MRSIIHHTISQKVPELFDLYTKLHGARVSLFSPDGALLYPTETDRPDCRHCSMLRKELRMDSLCRDLDRKMMQAAFEQEQMISYTCHAGMREACAPLIIDHELVGFVMIGQFRSDVAPTASPYAEDWKSEYGNRALQKEYDRTPVFPEEKIEMLLAMLRQLLELIISSQLIQHKDYDLIAPGIEQIRKQPKAPLPLADAARLPGRSPSTVTRLFKKITGRGFKQYQTDFRMQRAATLLRTHANQPVTEIAREAGFDDPLYFSRQFHRHFGVSPTQHRSNATNSR
jgi:AraC-like DNA-binding protein